MKKILVIVGTRPEAIKLIPMYKEFKKVAGWKTILVSTGQHREMLSSVFKFFDVKPDIDLKIMTKNQSLEKLIGALLSKFSILLRKKKPELVVVQGDTTTALTVALTAYLFKTKIAHVEAGLRSYDIQAPFPEEFNRRAISLVSDFHFAPTKSAVANLRREKVPGEIYMVGNTVIDSLLCAKGKLKERKKYFLKVYQQFFSNYNQMILITGHRRESFGEGFKNICISIKMLASEYQKTSFVYPVHLNPSVRKVVFKMLSGVPNIFLIEPVGYDHMVFLMTKSKLILTDSGGIQEEAPTLGKPVIVMRETTERPEGLQAGCCVLAGTSTDNIVRIVRRILNNDSLYLKMSRRANPYGKGDSAKRLTKILKEKLK